MVDVNAYPNLTVLPPSGQVRGLMTIIRDRQTRRNDFIFYSDRLTRLLVEKSMELLPVHPRTVLTPLDLPYEGVGFEGKICAVSIMRAGESMEKPVREVCKKIRLGKILIQRNEETAEPVVYYSKLPGDIGRRWVFLLDPMLATGGSAREAIRILLDAGVREDHIIFINLLACPQGLDTIFTAFPSVRIVTGEVDGGLNERSYIEPGLGDFGDRYFGT
jgi:uracil phosphoribosyltransferase